MNRKVLFGLFFLLGFVVLKFYPFFLKGLVPIPFDIMAGGYWPWRLVDYGFVAGVPIKNPIVSDVISQLFVWDDLSWRLLRQGLAPLWDRYSLLGYPYYANYHSAVFYPLNILGLILPSTIARSMVLFFTQIIAACGIYGYLIYKKKPVEASVLAGVFYISAGLVTGDFLFSSGSKAMAFLPYIFWTTDLYLDERRTRHLKIMSISWLFLFLSGHFQMTAFAVGIWSVYVAIKKCALDDKIKLVVFFLLGLAASSIQLVPTVELVLRSFRNSESYIQQVNYGILPLKHLATTFFAPDLFGNNATGNYFGFWNYRESVGYLGLISAFFIFAGVKVRIKSFWVVLFLTSLIMAFVPMVAMVVYKLKLPLISGSAASRWLFVSVFSGAMVLPDGVMSVYKKLRLRDFFIFGSLFAGVVIWVVVEKLAYKLSGVDLSGEVFFRNNFVSLRNLVLPILNFVFLAVILIAIKFTKIPGLRVGLLWLLVAFSCLDFLRFHFKFNSFVDQNLDLQKYEIHKNIDTNLRLSTTSDELFPPNSSTFIRVPSAQGYDPLYPQDNGIFLNAINGEMNPNKVGRYFNKISNTGSNLIDYSSTGYLATLTRDKQGLLSDKGEIPYFIDTDKWSETYRDKEMLILKNSTALPLIHIANKPSVMPHTRHLDLMMSDEKLTTYVEGLPATEFTNTASLEYKIFDNGEAEVLVKSNNDVFLVYNQAWYPGWEVLIDGKSSKLLRTNYIFSGVSVPAGEHEVRWIFRPKSFYFGSLISILSVLVISLYRNEQKIGRVFIHRQGKPQRRSR